MWDTYEKPNSMNNEYRGWNEKKKKPRPKAQKKRRKFPKSLGGKCLSGTGGIQNTNRQGQKRNSPITQNQNLLYRTKLPEKDQVTYKGRPIRMTQTSQQRP